MRVIKTGAKLVNYACLYVDTLIKIMWLKSCREDAWVIFVKPYSEQLNLLVCEAERSGNKIGSCAGTIYSDKRKAASLSANNFTLSYL